MSKRNLSLERQWRRRVRKFEKSGLTIREFCEQEELVDHQLAWWRRELRRRDGGEQRQKRTKRAKRASTAAANFIPVQVAPSRPSASLEIVLDERVRIAVGPGFDAQLLADVLGALEQRTC